MDFHSVEELEAFVIVRFCGCGLMRPSQSEYVGNIFDYSFVHRIRLLMDINSGSGIMLWPIHVDAGQVQRNYMNVVDYEVGTLS